VGWNSLRHPNVLPLLGVTATDNQLVMVSEWMANGNINEFVKAGINADRLELVRSSSKIPIIARNWWPP
jgi:serine/threonine protein kinase